MKKMIKRMLRAAGLEVHQYIPGSSSSAQLVTALNHFGIDLVMDVGANIGQFGEELRLGGYRGRIVSYEPLPDAFLRLKATANDDSGWHIYERAAVGAYNGEIEINIAQNSASSSVLPMLDSHLQAAPYSAYVDKLSVPIQRLDDTLDHHFYDSVAPFLKIDTQGYEWDVLDGAPRVLEKCKGVLLEMSLVPLYEGQYLWQDMIQRLESLGFTLWAIQPGFTDRVTGRTLQVDGIFFRV